MKYLIKLALGTLSLRVFSRSYGWLVRRRHPRFLIKRIIRLFKANYGIEMDNYQGDVDDYKSLSEFFVRPLDFSKRPLSIDETMLLSPADGKLTTLETIYQDKATQIKGKTYSISQVLGQDIDFSQGWHVAVIYLSPSNYHRYHYPVSGTVTGYCHTGARLYPVNNMGLNWVDQLFVSNERVVLEIEKSGLPVFAVAVGATFVGSIKMEFMPKKHKRHIWLPLEHNVRQLQEMGRFEMGSTIVLVIPEKLATPLPDITNRTTQVGQPLFRIIK